MVALIHIGQNQMVSSYHNLLLNYILWLFTVDLLKENVMHKKKKYGQSLATKLVVA